MTFDVMAELGDVAEALTDPYQSREPSRVWDANRNRVGKDHVVTIPGLVTQVGDMVWPSGRPDEDSPARSVPTSRMPGDPHASACYLDIHIAVCRWHMIFGMTMRGDIESSIRHLRARVASEDHDTRLALLDDMREWKHRCELVLGVLAPDPGVTAPCPVDGCGARTLRINVRKRTARCTTCRARWAETVDPEKGVGSIEVLGRHIQQHEAASRAEAAQARQVARVANERRYGRTRTG